MRARGTLAALAVVSMALAGCTSGSSSSGAGPSKPASIVEATDAEVPDAGSIAGSVVDDSLSPIEGAQVALLDTQVQAATDESGAFGFKNLAPGPYKIAAGALGFDSQAKTIDVKPNEAVTVQFMLTKIEIKEWYPEILGPESWFFDCRVGTPVLTGPCGVSGPNDKASKTFKMTEDVEAFSGEQKWQQGTFATSKQLRQSFSYQGRPSTHWYCTATSPSPVSWHYNMEEGCVTPPYCGTGSSQGTSGDHAKPNTKETLLIYTNTPFGCVSDPTHVVELSIQQKLEAGVTLFHNGPKPELWSIFLDT